MKIYDPVKCMMVEDASKPYVKYIDLKADHGHELIRYFNTAEEAKRFIEKHDEKDIIVKASGGFFAEDADFGKIAEYNKKNKIYSMPNLKTMILGIGRSYTAEEKEMIRQVAKVFGIKVPSNCAAGVYRKVEDSKTIDDAIAITEEDDSEALSKAKEYFKSSFRKPFEKLKKAAGIGDEEMKANDSMYYDPVACIMRENTKAKDSAIRTADFSKSDAKAIFAYIDKEANESVNQYIKAIENAKTIQECEQYESMMRKDRSDIGDEYLNIWNEVGNYAQAQRNNFLARMSNAEKGLYAKYRELEKKR